MLPRRSRPSKAYIPKALRRVKPVEDLSFDFSARQDWLSGFHKRKVARVKQAQEEAKKKEREEKIRDRKELRESRKAEIESHVRQVNQAIREAVREGRGSDADDSIDEFEGFASEPVVIPREDRVDEYQDEDKETTVVVEDVDITRDGLVRIADMDDEEEEKDDTKEVVRPEVKKKKVHPPKAKKPKFRYETKAERKMTRFKERAGKRKMAARRREE